MGACSSKEAEINYNNVIFYGIRPNASCIQTLNNNLSKCKSIHACKHVTVFQDINDKFYAITTEGNGLLNNNFISYNASIERICASPFSKCIFWLSDDGRVFGPNHIATASVWNPPSLIRFFNNNNIDSIQDIQSASNYCVALCGVSRIKKSLIITNWLKLFDISCDDIQSIILSFCDGSSIYSTLGRADNCWEYNLYCGNAHNELNNNNKHSNVMGSVWKEIDFFVDADIDKIAVGAYHSLFLKSNGTLWVCGSVCGSVCDNIYKPVEIEYFSMNSIKIKEIVCGSDHNLVLDYFGNVYSWGDNTYFQCGHHKTEKWRDNTIPNPEKIQFFVKYNIQVIDCGYFISYCKSVNGKHFIFGEWSTHGGYKNGGKIHSVNFKKLTNGHKIKSVVIGNLNATILTDS